MLNFASKMFNVNMVHKIFQFENSGNVVEPMQVDAPPEDNDNNEEESYIVENPSLDLEAYANSYSGLAKLNRLKYIADHCPSLRVEALKMGLTHLMSTFNVNLYKEFHKSLQETVGNPTSLPDVAGSAQSTSQDFPSLDLMWVENKTKKAALKLEKLDGDLKNYKSNSIKESIRRGHDDLGDHYLDCGDLPNALKCYSRARDYCTSGKHVVNMCLNVIKVSVYLQNWAHVLSYVNKAEATPDFLDMHSKDNQSNQTILTRLKCAAGLAELAMKKYKAAAKNFLQANLDHCDFPELLSAANVAVYGGLCALATFDRNELQKNVILSSSFKLFLELEPQLRDIIFKFYESKYASCLTLLEEIKDNLLLDMYIAPHVPKLYSQIRNRALIQYFSPYMSADLWKMAAAFNTTITALEDELMQLILDGQIQARIDSHNKILYAKDVDQRSTTFEKSLQIGKNYQRRTRMLILRAAVLKHQIHVRVSDSGAMESIDPESLTHGPNDSDMAMITTPYEPHDVTMKLRRRRRHTQPTDSLYHHKKHFREKRLRQAASFNDVEKITQILNDRDVDPDAADEQGRTALHLAASRGYAAVVWTLLNAGANPNAEDKLGNTPMHLAVYTQSIATVSHLLKGGCHLKKTTALPYTPLELVQSKYTLLEKQRNCTVPKSQTFRIMALLRSAIENDLFNQLTEEARKQEIDSLLKGLAEIELDDNTDAREG